MTQMAMDMFRWDAGGSSLRGLQHNADPSHNAPSEKFDLWFYCFLKKLST